MLSHNRVCTPLLLAAFACAPGDQAGPLVIQRDSAGITIVENQLPTGTQIDVWRISDPPVVQLGALEGDPNHHFNGIVSAVRLRDGRIAVGDRGSAEIRFFDVEGSHLHPVGGHGEGPGEFRLLAWVNRLPGDTLVASDWPVGELSWFDEQGTFLERKRIGFYWPGLAGQLMSDGSMIVDVWEKGSYGNEIEWVAAFGEDGAFRPSGQLVHVRGDSTQLDTLRAVEGEEWFKIGKPRQGLALHTSPFARTTRIAWHDDRVYVGETGKREIEALRLDGSIDRLIRWEDETSRISSADRKEFRAFVLDGLRQPTRRPDYERWLAAVPYPDAKPAFKTLMTDPAGRLWVAVWSDAGAARNRWTVFTSDGALLARADTPAGIEILEIGEDYVLALWKDDLDVEYVRLYGLDKT